MDRKCPHNPRSGHDASIATRTPTRTTHLQTHSRPTSRGVYSPIEKLSVAKLMPLLFFYLFILLYIFSLISADRIKCVEIDTFDLSLFLLLDNFFPHTFTYITTRSYGGLWRSGVIKNICWQFVEESMMMALPKFVITCYVMVRK